MKEAKSWRPETPSLIHDPARNGSPHRDHHHKSPGRVPTSSPHNSFGGNASSLSSRNSSLSRSQSITSLRSFFSRGRSASVASQYPDTSTARVRPATASGKHSSHSSGTVARAESPHLFQIGSQLDSCRPTQITHAEHMERARSTQQRARRRPSPSWDPPPLFQAYTQSLKHTILDASCLPTDVILRKCSHKSGQSLGEAGKAYPTDTQRLGLLLKRTREGSNKPARKLSASISSSGWTKHLFVLVESGYLLQYTGNGRPDRLPEKMMQLGKDTVAFASDAIPGRHWVLQVSQTAGDDAVLMPEPSKRILSRIGTQSAQSRRMTQNFLMVFDNAESLDSWLTAIRKEVEALGSRQYRVEEPTDVEARYLPAHGLSRSISVQNDSYRFPGSKFAPASQVLSPAESEFPKNDGMLVDEQMLEFRFWDAGTISRQSSDDSSTITSTDLDRLRDSKDSSGSTGTDTSINFHGQSPSSSPGQKTLAANPNLALGSVDDLVVLNAETEGAQMGHSVVVEPPSPTFLCHALDAVDVDRDSRKSSHSCTSNTRRLPCVTPNFSVPISSKRFSLFGSSAAPNSSLSRSSRATTSPNPGYDSFDEDPAENESFCRRRISTIAPLPTPEALMNPTGTRNRTSEHLSVDEPLPLQPVFVSQHFPPSLANRDFTPSAEHVPTALSNGLSSLETAMPMPSSPLLIPQEELPALPRSKSCQGRSTLDKAGGAATRSTFPALAPQGHIPQRPLSLSGFPEPPTRIQPVVGLGHDTEAPESLLLPRSLGQSSMTSLPTGNITEARTGSNSRLSRIRDSRGVPKLGSIPSSGPPPTCPLPDTPSPRRRHFNQHWREILVQDKAD